MDKLNRQLSSIGNLGSDGRPILGMDAKDFVKMEADSCPQCVVIPAHIWTPWFSLFGANSGFDNIEACFEEAAELAESERRFIEANAEIKFDELWDWFDNNNVYWRKKEKL